jgi:hypothetical protein
VKNKGWEKEPARHTLAAKGVKTKLEKVSRGLTTTSLKQLEAKVKNTYQSEWKRVRPILKEGRDLIDSVLGSNSANFNYTNSESYKELSVSDRKSLDDLNDAVEEICVNFALIAIRNDNESIVKDIEKIHSYAGEAAYDIIDPYGGGSG